MKSYKEMRQWRIIRKWDNEELLGNETMTSYKEMRQ